MMIMVFVGNDYNDDDGDCNEDGDDDDYRSPRYDVEWYAIRPRTLQRRHV